MVDVRIKSADTFAVTACVGTASYLNLFPLQLFKNLNGSVKNLERSNLTISGISGIPVSVAGKFTGTVIGTYGIVKFIDFYVIDSQIPVLLGYEFLNSKTIRSFQFRKNKLTLYRKINYKHFKTIFKYSENSDINKNKTNTTDISKNSTTPVDINKAQTLKNLGINQESDENH